MLANKFKILNNLNNNNKFNNIKTLFLNEIITYQKKNL